MIRHLLQKWATKMTYHPIPDRDNPDEVYLNRYHATEDMQDSWWFLHNFKMTDTDFHHNHPYLFQFSIILTGSYDEERLVPTSAGMIQWNRRCRFFNWITDTHYHKSTRLHGNVWTIFIHGPKTGSSWGFWVPGIGHVHNEALPELKARQDREHWSEQFRKAGAQYVH
jgi:hypothetical protein